MKTVERWFTPDAFVSTELFWRAMTHRSSSRDKNNEQLELLGDAVLHFVVTDWLTKSYPDAKEGWLCSQISKYTCGANLTRLAIKYDLGNYLMLGKGEEHSGGRMKPKLLEDAFEALIGATYRDGGLGSAAALITEAVLSDELTKS